MSDAAATLLEQVLALPDADRRWLADRLDASLDSPAAETEEEREFYDEIARRSDEAHAHPELLLDGEQVIAELRERLRRKRA